MSELISKVKLEVDGQEITDFMSITDPTIKPYKEVELANKTAFMEQTERYTDIKLEYVIPKDGPEFDWKGLKNGRLTIDYRNGKRVTYTGVYPLEIGGAKLGGKDEPIREITLGATGRIEE